MPRDPREQALTSPGHRNVLSRRRFLLSGGMIAAGTALSACGGSGSADHPEPTAGSPATVSISTGETMTTSEFPAGVQVHGPVDGPAVLVLHPWWGISPGVLAWKDTLVGAGARVVLPDLYGGTVVDTIKEAEAMSNAIDERAAFAMLDACAQQLNASGRPWTALGWSLGASYSCRMMNRGELAPYRAVLFYGGSAPAGNIRTQAVQLHIAPADEYFTDQEITDALEGFEHAGVAVERFDYPGLGHWFAEVGSPGYNEQGTTLATGRVLTFLGLPSRG